MDKLTKDIGKFMHSHGVPTTTFENYVKYVNSGVYPITSGGISPTILEERKLNAVAIDIFSRLMYERIMFLGTVIDDEVSNIIVSQLLYLDSVDKTDIQMYINSPGGSVQAGYACYDIMQSIQSNVSTLCLGTAASMAAVLLAAGANGKRLIIPHGKVMIHQPLGGVCGQASDIEIHSKEIMKTKKALYTTLSKHTGKAYDEIVKDADRDFWMDAEEAIEYGIVDKVIGIK